MIIFDCRTHTWYIMLINIINKELYDILARYCRGLQHLNIQDVAGVSLQGYRAVRAHCRRWPYHPYIISIMIRVILSWNLILPFLQVYYRTYEPWFPLTVKENPVKVCSGALRGNECNRDFFSERKTKMQETVAAFFNNLCDPWSLPSCLNFNLSLWCLWRQCNFPLPKCNFQMKSWNILFQFPRRRRSLIQMSIYKWFRRWRAAPAGQEQFQFQSAGQHHWH